MLGNLTKFWGSPAVYRRSARSACFTLFSLPSPLFLCLFIFTLYRNREFDHKLIRGGGGGRGEGKAERGRGKGGRGKGRIQKIQKEGAEKNYLARALHRSISLHTHNDWHT